VKVVLSVLCFGFLMFVVLKRETIRERKSVIRQILCSEVMISDDNSSIKRGRS
jgi:NADH:ubiquinone oxidoreductase subunit K